MCEQIKRKIHAVLLSSEQKIKKKEKKTNQKNQPLKQYRITATQLNSKFNLTSLKFQELIPRKMSR